MATQADVEKMAALVIKPTVPVPPTLPKLKKGTQRTVVTNSYPVNYTPNTPYYGHDFRVHAVFARKGAEKLMEITKQTSDDYNEQVRKQVAMIAFEAMLKSGALKGDFIYDRAAQLISLQEIPQCKGGAEFVTILTKANAPKLFKISKVNEAKEIRVMIKKVNENYSVNTNDLDSKDENTRKTLLNVTSLATSQSLFEKTDDFIVYGNGIAYLLQPQKHGFPTHFDMGTKDKYGGFGLTKGVRIIEGPDGKTAAAVTVDVKKSGFHKDLQLVSDKLAKMGCTENQDVAATAIGGLKALVFYKGVPEEQQRSREITIGFMGHERVRDVFFDDKNGRRINLAQYIQSKYKTTVNGSAYVIIDKYEGNKYSPETLLIAPNQRVKTENAQPANTEKIIRVSATVPAVRQAETATLARAMDASSSNPAQVRRGITVDTREPIKVPARVLGPVLLSSNSGMLSVTGPWRQDKIAQAPLDRFQKWSIIHLKNQNSNEHPELAEYTAAALVRAAGNIGWKITLQRNAFQVNLETGNQEAQLDRIIAQEKEDGSQFILVLAHSYIKNHQLVKYLEVKNDIITEQVTTEVAQKITHGNQSNTACNVALKMCEKLGGQTHFISKTTTDLPAWFTHKDTMFVGLQMVHPSALSGKEKEANAMPARPVMIGYSSNAVRGAAARGASDAQQEKEATHFSSGWDYAMTKDYKEGADYYKSYKEVVLNILLSFKKYRGTVPQKIVVFRGGVAEGDYQKIRIEEIPIWEAAFLTLSEKYNPNFIFLTVNEAHSDRFFQEKIPTNEKAPRQNLPSGTVIDSGITNPALAQFFLQSHVPLQGTAKVPSYVVQHVGKKKDNPLNVTLDDLERIAHALCFAHGVCNTPTAVPTPLYVAQESMKRASELFQFWQRRLGGRTWNLEDVRKNLTLNPETSVIHGLRLNA